VERINKIISHFAKVNDNYIVTNGHNGFIVEIAGQDKAENWITSKLIFKTLDELKAMIELLARLPRI
jgi:uncharacterized membrane protein